MRKTILMVISIMIMATMFAVPTLAASHNPDSPTVIVPNEWYSSNAYYGDDYYTFTLDDESTVNIWLGRVAMNHTYTMTLRGDGIDDISTNDTTDDALTISTVLSPGTYYIDVDSDFNGNGLLRTEPDEAGYQIIIRTNPI